MKKYIFTIIAFGVLVFSSCDKDNYDEPEGTFKGKLVTSTGSSIGVKGSEEAVRMQLWQDGFEKYEPIDVFVNQSGEFAAKLFNGKYKLVTRDNNGPWINDRDTLVVDVNGSTNVEFKVTPYFELKNEEFKVENEVLTATFDISQVSTIQGRDLENITLYVNNTVFVDNSFKKKGINAINPIVGKNTITMDIKDLGNPSYHPILYARIGVKISGVDQLLYTTGSVKIR